MRRAIALLASLIASAQCSGIGDRLAHTFLKFDSLPMTTADTASAGWEVFNDGSCIPNLGVPYFDGSSPSKSDPILLYYTAVGQLTGTAVRVFGDLPPTLIPDWYTPVDDESHQVTITFREGSSICDPSFKSEDILGDRVIINQQDRALTVPNSESEAISAGWLPGACIGGMGRHYSLDIDLNPMSFNGSRLVPVTPMYSQEDGGISAILFSTPTLQQHQPLFGPWEGPFPLLLWCKNWCSSDCSDNFSASGASWWNSMHFLFRDHHTLKCPNSCPSDVSSLLRGSA